MVCSRKPEYPTGLPGRPFPVTRGTAGKGVWEYTVFPCRKLFLEPEFR